MAFTFASDPHKVQGRSKLFFLFAEIANLFRSRVALLLDNPDPFDVLRSNPADIVCGDAVQHSTCFVLQVVVCRFVVQVFDHA